ncbi:MAG: nitrous oxide reductase family maturation protein NosD [Saprospiraceae bacterium]|nr:nitrous oxide reductase family maturation protein NosD [Saprospiraceae bacterium]
MKILCIAISFLSWTSIFGNRIEVCPTCAFTTIEEAYKSCENGDTLEIKAGIYKIPNWKIQKSIVVRGEKNTHLISQSGEEIITVEKSNVTIQNISFSGVVTNYLKENAAIRVKRCKNVNILNNTIIDCFFAIYLERTKHTKVYGNTINGNKNNIDRTEAESGNGIHAWHCDSILIAQNDIMHHRDGIYLEFVNNSEMNDNRSHDNSRYGLHYMFSNDDSYRRNIIEHNGVGVAVMFSRRIIMTENTFAHNWGHAAYGLLLKEIYDAEISDNKFTENTVAIFVEGSNRINYLRNSFRKNGWAIKFSGGCESNKISNNDFLYNSIDLVVSSQLNNNTFNGNYWSEYTGYDLDNNKIGDVPHYPVKLYSYIHNQVPESVVLMRSLFVDILNFAEKVSPIFTPKDVKDDAPKMNSNL